MSAALDGVGPRAVAAGLITEDELAAAERTRADRGVSLDDALVELNLLTEDQVVGLRGAALDLPVVFPYARTCDRHLVAAFPVDLLRRHDALPLARDGEHVVVALPTPPTAEARAALERAAGGPVRVALAGRHRLRRALAELLGSDPAQAPGDESIDSAALRLLYGQLARAMEARADELRFDVIGDELVVRARLGDGLVLCTREPATVLPALLARARSLLGAPGVSDADRPLIGVVPVHLGGRDALFEVSVLPARTGSSVLVRVVPSPAPARLEDLGLPAPRLEALRRLSSLRRGLVLVAGSDGARVRALAWALAAAEDPLDRAVLCLVQEPHRAEPSSQHVDRSPGLDRDAWLRDALRHRPDVLVAEAEHPDGPPLRSLVRAARTALVLAAVDAPDEVEALILTAERVARPALLARALAGLVLEDGRVTAPSPALRDALERRALPAELRAIARGERTWT